MTEPQRFDWRGLRLGFIACLVGMVGGIWFIFASGGLPAAVVMLLSIVAGLVGLAMHFVAFVTWNRR